MKWFMIAVGSILVIALIAIGLLLKQKKSKKTVTKAREIPEEEIESVVLDEESPKEPEKKETVSDDTLDLDDLFKTMSIHVLKDDPNFDFGLRRKKD